MSKTQDTQTTDTKRPDLSKLKSPAMRIVEKLLQDGVLDENDPAVKMMREKETELNNKVTALEDVLEAAYKHEKRPERLMGLLSECVAYVAHEALDEIMNGEQPNLNGDLQRMIGGTVFYQAIVNNAFKILDIPSLEFQDSISALIKKEAENGNFNASAAEIIKAEGPADLSSVLNANKVQSNCCGDTQVHSSTPS